MNKFLRENTLGGSKLSDLCFVIIGVEGNKTSLLKLNNPDCEVQEPQPEPCDGTVVNGTCVPNPEPVPCVNGTIVNNTCVPNPEPVPCEVTNTCPTPEPEPTPDPVPVPQPSNETVNVVMVGDVYGSVGKTVLESIKAKEPNLVIGLGDLGYDSGSYLQSTYAKLGNAFACIIGNHDDATFFGNYCGNDWFITLNKALFIGINTEGNEDAQATKAVNLVKNQTFMENITSVHLLSHKPCVAPEGSHHPVSEDVNAQKACFKIFNAVPNGVEKFADNGHNHGLAAGEQDGITIHQSGGGGRDLYDCQTDDVFSFCEPMYGFLVYKIEPDGKTTSQFYNEKGVKVN